MTINTQLNLCKFEPNLYFNFWQNKRCNLMYENQKQTAPNCIKLIDKMSRTLFRNPKGPVELGNANTCAETKLCLIFVYSDSSSLAMSLKLLYIWFKQKLGLVPLKTLLHNKQRPLPLIRTNVFQKFTTDENSIPRFA